MDTRSAQTPLMVVVGHFRKLHSEHCIQRALLKCAWERSTFPPDEFASISDLHVSVCPSVRSSDVSVALANDTNTKNVAPFRYTFNTINSMWSKGSHYTSRLLALLIKFRKVQDSNLDPETTYPEWSFFLYFFRANSRLIS